MRLLTALIALGTLLLGAVVGYLVRFAEFSRDQRVQAYSEFVAAFLEVAHTGAGMFSAFIQLGAKAFYEDDEVSDGRRHLAEATQAFEAATARVRLVASKSVREVSETLEEFVSANVLYVPPLRPTAPASTWGAAASVGPSKIDSEAARLSRAFADTASRDVTLRRRRT